MPEGPAAAGVDVIVPDEWPPLLLIGLVGAEFAALLGLLIWMS